MYLNWLQNLSDLSYFNLLTEHLIQIENSINKLCELIEYN